MRSRAVRVRAGAVGLLAAAGVVALYVTRPATSADDPEAAVVTAATWLAWAIAVYVVTALGVAAAAHLGGSAGAVAARCASAAPVAVRRVAEVLVGGAVTAAAAGLVAPAAVADPPPRPSPAVATLPSLDWPGLAAPAAPRPHPGVVGRTSAATRAVTVAAGDSLWDIAARHLPPGTSPARVAAEWPRWWAANRAVIGPDPGVIRPGQVLTVPPSRRQP